MKYLLASCLVVVSGLALQAHHDHHDIHIRSLTCGWIEGDNLRDIRNLTDFCGRSVPATFRIASAAATRERLWIEAPADVISALRVDGPATADALLREWLRQWKRISGYPAASVVLMYRHAEVGSARTTIGGDAIIVR
jgi:hypothetical protein